MCWSFSSFSFFGMVWDGGIGIGRVWAVAVVGRFEMITLKARGGLVGSGQGTGPTNANVES